MIDGFPRNESNTKGWLDEFKEECVVLAVLFLGCPEETCFNRIGFRRQSSGRIDDNVESLKKRFAVFRAETLPNIEILRGITKVIEVDADKNIPDVFDDVCKEFDLIL